MLVPDDCVTGIEAFTDEGWLFKYLRQLSLVSPDAAGRGIVATDSSLFLGRIERGAGARVFIDDILTYLYLLLSCFRCHIFHCLVGAAHTMNAHSTPPTKS